jgi:uncharacterized protein (DUF1810 family)
LGPRLRECVELVLAITDRKVEDIFPHPDHLKFCSCLTLFEHASTPPDLFEAALAKYFGGARDRRTVDILRRQGPPPPPSE